MNLLNVYQTLKSTYARQLPTNTIHMVGLKYMKIICAQHCHFSMKKWIEAWKKDIGRRLDIQALQGSLISFLLSSERNLIGFRNQ